MRPAIYLALVARPRRRPITPIVLTLALVTLAAAALVLSR